MSRVGFIGLGIMGLPMAKHLIAAGHALHVFNRTANKADEVVALGATRHADAGSAAERCANRQAH